MNKVVNGESYLFDILFNVGEGIQVKIKQVPQYMNNAIASRTHDKTHTWYIGLSN
jgi:hypothetical protein